VEVEGVKTSEALITKGVPVPDKVMVLLEASKVLVPEEETMVKTLVTVILPAAV